MKLEQSAETGNLWEPKRPESYPVGISWCAIEKGGPSQGPPLNLLQLNELLCADRLRTGVEPGFVAAGSVLVQDALLDTLVYRRGGSAEGRLGARLVALGNSFAHLAQSGAQP